MKAAIAVRTFGPIGVAGIESEVGSAGVLVRLRVCRNPKGDEVEVFRKML
jgi:hypothetical protein